ncbi:MAG TPA: hypothetical protein VNQ52_05335 [Microbacteriaceae bacterium]|nr:hypothetical protein [Microbacteriaceae bacterium]
MVRARRIASAATVAAIAATLTLGAAAPAQAVTGGVELSLNGVSWSSSLNGSVFPAGQSLVPGSRISGTFFVRNGTNEAAWVRVGVSNMTVTSMDFALAMNLSTVGTTNDGASGSSSKVGADDIVCSDFLNRDTPLAPGGVVRVDASLWFRPDVTGTTAQNEAAQVAFIAELAEVDLNTLGQPLCTNTLTIGPVTPAPPGPTPGGDPGGGGTGTGPADLGGAGTGTGSGAGTTGQSSTPGAGSTGSIAGGSFEFGWGGPRPFTDLDANLAFNTVQWWEEYAIFVLIGAAVAGAFARIYVQRRWVVVDRRTGEPRWQGSKRPAPAGARRASGRTSRPASAPVFSSSSSVSPLR